jgi:hypothetical protein
LLTLLRPPQAKIWFEPVSGLVDGLRFAPAQSSA